MRVRYARTSTDEADTGQDVRAQVAQLEGDVPDAVATFVDDGVSGSVHPMRREGFGAAVMALPDGGVIVARDLKRIGRLHPAHMAMALDALARRGISLEFTNDYPLGSLLLDEQSEVEAGMHFFRFYGPWAELVTGRKTTLKVMQTFKGPNGAPTRSGKPVGRPKKVTDQEAERYHPIAAEKGPAEAARLLSVEKGWRPDMDPRTAKKYRVTHSTLIGAFQRVGLTWPCVGNPAASETVSDTEAESCGGKGSVSDGVNTAPGGDRPGTDRGPTGDRPGTDRGPTGDRAGFSEEQNTVPEEPVELVQRIDYESAQGVES